MAQQYDNTNSCAVWKRKDKNGNTYVFVSGTTESGEQFSFSCFANKFKETEKQPDFRSSRHDPRKDFKEPAKANGYAPGADEPDDQIPFN